MQRTCPHVRARLFPRRIPDTAHALLVFWESAAHRLAVEEELLSQALLRIFTVLIAVAIPLASFVTGLRSSEPFWLWKRPRLLARSLLAVLLVVPILTTILIEVLSPGSAVVRAGIAVSILSIGIGPPQMLKSSRHPTVTARYEMGLDVTLLGLAILYVPIAVALHGLVFSHPVKLPPAAVARVVLLQALVPTAIGIAVARLFPKIVAPVARYAELFVLGVLTVVVVVALIVAWRPLLALGAGAWLTCAAISMAAILVGHAMGGPTMETRTVLASFSAIRFPGLALLLVSMVPGGRVLIPVILAYLMSSAVFVAAYRAATAKRVHGEHVEARR